MTLEVFPQVNEKTNLKRVPSSCSGELFYYGLSGFSEDVDNDSVILYELFNPIYVLLEKVPAILRLSLTSYFKRIERHVSLLVCRDGVMTFTGKVFSFFFWGMSIWMYGQGFSGFVNEAVGQCVIIRNYI